MSSFTEREMNCFSFVGGRVRLHVGYITSNTMVKLSSRLLFSKAVSMFNMREPLNTMLPLVENFLERETSSTVCR